MLYCDVLRLFRLLLLLLLCNGGSCIALHLGPIKHKNGREELGMCLGFSSIKEGVCGQGYIGKDHLLIYLLD